jgi:hypothetical protein
MSNAFVEGMSNVLTPASARLVVPPSAPALESAPTKLETGARAATRVAPSVEAAANPELAPSSWEDFRGATGASEVPSTIAELEQYRRMRRGKTAEGKPFPRVELSKLPGDPRVPPSVGKLMHGIDALLPELMKEKGLTLDRLFELSLPRAERGHANRWQKTLAGAGALTAGAVAMQLAQAIVDPTSAAVAAGSFLIGQKLAGAVSYVVHDLIDEYDFMKDAFEFQVHHEDPGELGRWDFSNTVANIGQLTVPAMGILAAVAPTLGLAPGAAAFAFVGALWLAPAMHKVTHLPRQRPLAEDATPLERWKHKLEGVQRKAIEMAQQMGLMPSKERHLEHHAGRRTGRMEGEKTLAHTESFDVSSGSLGVDVNQLFNDLEVSQRLKRTIYTTTKAAARAHRRPHTARARAALVDRAPRAQGAVGHRGHHGRAPRGLPPAPHRAADRHHRRHPGPARRRARHRGRRPAGPGLLGGEGRARLDGQPPHAPAPHERAARGVQGPEQGQAARDPLRDGAQQRAGGRARAGQGGGAPAGRGYAAWADGGAG